MSTKCEDQNQGFKQCVLRARRFLHKQPNLKFHVYFRRPSKQQCRHLAKTVHVEPWLEHGFHDADDRVQLLALKSGRSNDSSQLQLLHEQLRYQDLATRKASINLRYRKQNDCRKQRCRPELYHRSSCDHDHATNLRLDQPDCHDLLKHGFANQLFRALY